MKLLFVVDRAVAGTGPHRNVVGSLNALGRREDVTITLLTGQVDPDEPYSRAGNIQVVIGFEPHQRKRAWRNISLVARADDNIDVVYVPSGLKALLYAQLARRPGRPLVAGPNVTPLPNRLHDSPSWPDLRLLSNVWFEASRIRREHVVRESGNDSVRFVHHAIDHAKFSPQHRKPEIWDNYGIANADAKILYVGKDKPIKGVSQLLEAFQMLPSTVQASLVLVGELLPSTRERVREMEKVYPLGFKSGSELAAIFASADIAMIPSRWENLPFTVLESMASGVAIIAGNAGGIPELIEDGKSGLLVDIRDEAGRHREDAAKTIAEAIERLAGDEELRRCLGANARQRALEHFSEERLGENLMALFREAQAGNAGRPH